MKMCNVDEGETHPVKAGKILSPSEMKCVKCGEPAVVVIRIRDPFCKSCFQVYVTHKFRAAIGKSKLIRDGEQVLVAFSGRENASALLNLIQDGLSERAHKKLRFIPTLLHVDEFGILSDNVDERRDVRQRVVKLMVKSTFPSYLIDLEQCLQIGKNGTSAKSSEKAISNGVKEMVLHRLNQDIEKISNSLPAGYETTQLNGLLSKMTSLTSREDLLRNLRTQTIVASARHLGFSKVLTADCSTRLAVRILTDVSQGRGSQVSLNTGFSDCRNGDVMIIRPVRDLNAKELTMYNRLFDVQSIFTPCLSTKKDSGASIERLTEQFITGLHAEFPSTVSNIVRTSEKLGLPNLEGTVKCSFCQSPLDTNVGNASALRAVQYSQKFSCASRMTRPSLVAEEEKANGVDSTPSTNSLEEFYEYLCYGCRLSLHNMDTTVDSLPEIITRKRITRLQQKAQVEEFLLQENCSGDDLEDTELGNDNDR